MVHWTVLECMGDETTYMHGMNGEDRSDAHDANQINCRVWSQLGLDGCRKR